MVRYSVSVSFQNALPNGMLVFALRSIGPSPPCHASCLRSVLRIEPIATYRILWLENNKVNTALSESKGMNYGLGQTVRMAAQDRYEECPYQVVLPRQQLTDDSAILDFLLAHVGWFDMYVETTMRRMCVIASKIR